MPPSTGSESLTVEDAISLYTKNAAYASFEEHTKGSIEIGKLADLVVLEKDPRKVPASNISQIRVLMTIIGGKIAFRSLNQIPQSQTFILVAVSSTLEAIAGL